MLTENELDNILIRQKDAVLHLVRQGRHKEARTTIRVLTELWVACSYEYKLDEIMSRLDPRHAYRKKEDAK
jgi:hypothetical protein